MAPKMLFNTLVENSFNSLQYFIKVFSYINIGT